MKQLHHFVNGEPVTGTARRVGPIFNPATGEQTGEVPFASPGEIDQAVTAAREALPAWAEMTPASRARLLFRFREVVQDHVDELAGLLTAEHGKTSADAKGSVTRGLEVVEFACGIPHLLKGEFSSSVGSEMDSWSLRQPVGVCVGISPFNFPAMVPMWMFPIALACGNTFVLKPSEKDPSTPIRIAELAAEAGIPAGVLNVINGDKEAVDALLAHPDVAAVSFVGSTPVAEYIYKTAAANGKRVQALGGAKNHMVVMPDADLDQTTEALIGGAYGSAGERCMSVSVAVAVGDAGDPLIERLTPRVSGLKVAPGVDPDSEMGPLVTREHLARVRGYIDLGVEEGADLVLDGRDLKLQGYEDGYFIGGSVFDNVTADMRIYKEEIFGPVLSVMRVPDFDTAVALVNEHEFGNGAAIFTEDGGTARTFADRVKIGMVGVNVPIPVPMAFHTFGGWKRSLFGDLAMHGPDGVRFYTRLKTVTSRWPGGALVRADFSIPTPR